MDIHSLRKQSMSALHVRGEAVRLDKWLWAARFYKTRAAAADAVDGGKVQVNGDRVKCAKRIRVGDDLRIRRGPYEYRLRVLDLAEQRLPPPAAARLYEETEESRQARAALALQIKYSRPPGWIAGEHPTKRERRELRRLKGKG